MKCCCLGISNLPPSLSDSSVLTGKCRFGFRYYYSPLKKRQMRFHGFHALRCHKMYVPGFGGASPESKAARNLQDFFTYAAVRIVLAQLEVVFALFFRL
ncbi:hypothetical protein BHE74_00006777 [Ensete ventricosum]|uniref:Uncharacterized protein n=1 Tax=Ensete ventricosum TaxID=4639 RepID=A0A426Y2X5_ENSVE|nr:hypothetical protein B296_00003921 [Ensete ventricosum]RWV87165.1 hypothetical protein GW17_00050867 [Ensete ventricosum]RWW84607.1 hypothetical protein BHE74_00006777 [Ensete ventricosum]RZS15983.1 hypothetical protein BHM03_00047910 [Ensete ventricosum]